VRIAWDDGDGTHDLEDLIQHGLAFEEGEDGQCALGLVPSKPSESSASTSSSDEEGEGEGEEESSRPPLATTNTKASVAWKHEPDGIREDNRHPSLDSKDEKPRFRCGDEHITSPLMLFLYLLPDALKRGAVRRAWSGA